MSAPSSGGASRDGYGAALLEMIDDDDVVVPVSYTHLTLPTICSV